MCQAPLEHTDKKGVKARGDFKGQGSFNSFT